MKKNTKLIGLLISIAILSIGCFFLLSYLKKTDKISKSIALIDPKDKQVLEVFFKELLLTDRFAYVLLGSKPMALAVFHQSMPEDMQSSHNQTLKNGWATWQKYQHLFSHDHFIFRTFEDSEQKDIKDLILINKKNFLNELEQHPEECDLLTQQVAISEWFNSVKETSASFNECFHYNHILKGIAFGFGKHNSQMFQKKWDIFNSLEEKYPDQDSDFLSDEYEKLPYKVILSLMKDGDPKAKETLMLPIFAADLDHEETRGLSKRYAQDREMIISILSKESFLEAALEKFSSNAP